MKTLTDEDVCFFLSCTNEGDARFQEIASFVNIAICEWRGWRHEVLEPIDPEKTWIFPSDLPSHITGIEALGNMKAARESLIGEQRDAYEECLKQQIGARIGLDRGDYDCVTPFDMMQAEEREHAIALLRVVRPEMFND